MRPLLMANVAPYCGPWVPAHDLEGSLEIHGMSESDQVSVRIETDEAVEERTFINNGRVTFEPKPGMMLQAERISSSGHEVFIWAS